MDEWTLTKVRTQRNRRRKKTQLRFVGLVVQILGFSAFPSLFSRKYKKTLFFFWPVKGNDTGMELPLLSLKSQQSIINNFWNLIRMLVFFFFWHQIKDFVGLLKQNRQKSVFLKVKWMFNEKKKVKWFVYSDWRKRWVVQKRFLS